MTARSATVLDPALRAALAASIRRRVPPSEVDDIVQATLAEALGSAHAPPDKEALVRWVFGVARNKVADFHRRTGKETFEVPELSGDPAAHVEADLLRWAERNLPPGRESHKTLEWMLREGDGEKLESIAESEQLPAPRVRQRVSRLRRHLKEHWAREVALLAALGIAITAVIVVVRRPGGPIVAEPDDRAPRAERMRQKALERCSASDWAACLEGLDAARTVDPAGDARPDIRQARDSAAAALRPPAPAPAPAPAPTPSPSAAPSAAPPTKTSPPRPLSTEAPPPPPFGAPSKKAATPAPAPKRGGSLGKGSE